jgi:hypothetical protein
MQTIYKHWILWLKLTKATHGLPPHVNIDDWYKIIKLGLVSEVNGVYTVTSLGQKVLDTAEAMDELKSKDMKLSW